MKKRAAYRFLSFSFVICFAICMAASMVAPVSAAAGGSEQTVLFFTSDVHQTSSDDTASANRLKLFLEYVTTAFGKPDALGVCGDLATTVTGDRYWNRAQRVMTNVEELGIEGIYTTGNHEHENGSFSTTSNDIAKKFIRLGLGKAADNYEIFCFGAASGTMEFPDSDIEALEAYLKSVGTEKPVFILSHYPLHSFTYTSGGKTLIRDAANREKVIDLLNQYPNTFFIWGHNHSKEDPNYNTIFTECIGDKEINFTYASAGAMTDVAENKYAGHITGKCLVALVSADGKSISLRYLDVNYEPIAEWSHEADIRVPVSFSGNGGSETLQMSAVPSEPIIITAVCYNDAGKMLGLSVLMLTPDGTEDMITLQYPPDVKRSETARLRLMAVNSADYCPLAYPVTQ